MMRNGGQILSSLIATDWFGFFIVGFGTFFLLGEMLVNMRGLFAVLGLFTITSYFYFYTIDSVAFVTMLVIYFIGLLFIFIDGKMLNDGTLGVLGLVGMIFSVAITAPNLFAGLYAVLGIIIGASCSFLLLKLFKRRNMWSKMMLKDRLTKEQGYTTLNEEYEQLVGKKAITMTDMRPAGTIEVDGKQYSAVTNGMWIEKGTEVTVIEVDGTKILVTK